MSHIVSISTRLTDLEAIKKTCQELGLVFKEHQTSYRWYGHLVNRNTPLPAGFTVKDLGHCEHAIEVPGAGYDIGLARAKDGNGWKMLFDYWGPGEPILAKIGGEKGGKFLQTYGVCKAEIAARKLGFNTTRQTLKNGSVNVLVRGSF